MKLLLFFSSLGRRPSDLKTRVLSRGVHTFVHTSLRHASEEEEESRGWRPPEEGAHLHGRYRTRLSHDPRHRRSLRRVLQRGEHRGRVQDHQAILARTSSRHPPRQGRLRGGVPRRAGRVRRPQGQEELRHRRHLRILLRAERQHQQRVQARQRCRRELQLPGPRVLREHAREHQRPSVPRRDRQVRQVHLPQGGTERRRSRTDQRLQGLVQVWTRRDLPPGSRDSARRRRRRHRRRHRQRRTRAEEEARTARQGQAQAAARFNAHG